LQGTISLAVEYALEPGTDLVIFRVGVPEDLPESDRKQIELLLSIAQSDRLEASPA
jgi:hypothetical protein